MSRKLQEAAGSIDKLYGLIEKAISSIAKAQSAVLDCCDSMDAILVEATSIGGSLAQTVPSHIKLQISKLTQIADKDLGDISDGGDASALKKLLELVENTPYRDIKPETSSTRIANIAGQPNIVSPNLAAGAQSAIKENLDEYYTEYMRPTQKSYANKSLSFDALRESGIYGEQLEGDMMEAVNLRMAKPIQTKQVRERQIRANIEDSIYEEGEQLQEEGPLDFSNLRAFGGSDGMPLKFDSIREGGHIV